MRMHIALLMVCGALWISSLLAPTDQKLFVSTKVSLRLVEEEGCLLPFNQFAYQGPRKRSETKSLPVSPWRISSHLPTNLVASAETSSIPFQTALTRFDLSFQEIWIKGGVYNGIETIPLIFVYHTTDHDWELITADIDASNLYVTDLFVDEYERVWGAVSWNTLEKTNEAESFPILSLFNESNRRFELVESSPKIQLKRFEIRGKQTVVLTDRTRIVFSDKRGIFWIFITEKGVYQYSIHDNTSRQSIELKNADVSYIAPSSDGSIYLSVHIKQNVNYEASTNPSILHFNPETNQLTSVSIPDRYRAFNGLFVDRLGRLWLGAIAYQDLDGHWKPVHADVMDLPKHFRDPSWATPAPFLEDSSGRIWFRKWLDSGVWNEGTAWYNPLTREGCMFTNLPVNVIEDGNNRFWLIADYNLYTYFREP